MSRQCHVVQLDDGTLVRGQFSGKPTAEDVAALKELSEHLAQHIQPKELTAEQKRFRARQAHRNAQRS